MLSRKSMEQNLLMSVAHCLASRSLSSTIQTCKVFRKHLRSWCFGNMKSAIVSCATIFLLQFWAKDYANGGVQPGIPPLVHHPPLMCHYSPPLCHQPPFLLHPPLLCHPPAHLHPPPPLYLLLLFQVPLHQPM